MIITGHYYFFTDNIRNEKLSAIQCIIMTAGDRWAAPDALVLVFTSTADSSAAYTETAATDMT
ncbi:MAG: hypothetical protein ACXVBX_11535, partial [Flavisolibacter sp.]